MSDSVICQKCGASIPATHRFCGVCGSPLVPITPAQEPISARQACLVLVRGEGVDGARFALTDGEQILGRNEGSMRFPDDPYLSPAHAVFFYQGSKLYVRDFQLGKTNGVFVRIHGEERLEDGDCFLAGEELLRIETNEQHGVMVTEDQTQFFASPRPGRPQRLTQILDGGRLGLCYLAHSSKFTIGRQNCDVTFPHDRFISGSHCAIAFDGQSVRLIDSKSRNGTYVRIKTPRELVHGDQLFVGKQLLRVEMLSGGNQRY